MSIPEPFQHVEVDVENVPGHVHIKMHEVPQVILRAPEVCQEQLHVHQVPSGMMLQDLPCRHIQLEHMIQGDADIIGYWSAIFIRALAPGSRCSCPVDEHCLRWYVDLCPHTI